MELQSIGKKIKDKRQQKNISQEKLAELVDVTPSYISNIESGNRVASLPTMLEIVKVLDLSLDYLLLENVTDDSDNIETDKFLIEFKNILEQLNDKKVIKEYIVYCKGLANSMIEIKKGTQKKTSEKLNVMAHKKDSCQITKKIYRHCIIDSNKTKMQDEELEIEE